jgi:type IV secretion/conjugal transfer VirB4 family ATPase
MTATVVLVLILGVAITGVGALYGRRTFSVFTLSEHKRNPDRFSDHLPWAMLVAPGVVFHKNGSFQTTFAFRGPDLDSATEAELVITSSQINNTLKRLTGGWALYADAHRRREASYRESSWPDALTHLLDEERRLLFQGDNYYDSTRYLTLIYLPAPDVANKVARWFYEGGEAVSSSYQDELTHFTKIRDDITHLLAGVLKEIRPLSDDETCTYLHACVSPRTHPVKAPDIPMFLDSLLTDTPLTGGFAPKLGDYHVQVLSIAGFPNSSTPGILDILNRLDFEYRWVTRFIFLEKTEAEKLLRGFWQRWLSGRQSFVALMREAITGQGSAIQNTDALNKSADADAALQELSGDLVSFGYYTQCVVLLDRDLKSLKAKQSILEQAIAGRGFVTLDEIENRNCFDAFLGSIPGNCAHNVRHPMLNTLNLAHLFPLSAVWGGEPTESNLYDAPPLLHTVTGGSTPFKFNLNYGDVGHTCIIGPTGAGKSVLLAAIATAFSKYRAPSGEFSQVYFFDKERSSRITTLGVGGDFYDLAAEGSSLAFQPLARIDEEHERNWGMEWLQALLRHEAKSATFVTPERKTTLWNALSRLAVSPMQERTLTGLRTLVQDKAIKDALASYCLDGPYGRLLDAETETLSVGRWQVFEMHELMKSYPNAVMPLLTYLFHRLDQRFGKAPTLLILDEGWLFLDDPVFAPKIREWLKTLRKKKVYVVFASQSLADLAQSTILETVKESCFTKIYLPNRMATDDERSMAFYRGFGLNDQQIALIAAASPKREYYFTSPVGNRLFSLALGELGLAYCAATSADDQGLADRWSDLPTARFNDEYLRAKGLDWAAEALAAAANESERKSA